MAAVTTVSMAVVLDATPAGTEATCCACPFRVGPGAFRVVFEKVTAHYVAEHADPADGTGRRAG